MNITITGISLDGHSVPVPNGLSELLNAASVWCIKKNEPVFIGDYERRTEQRNGNLVTVLTLKRSS